MNRVWVRIMVWMARRLRRDVVFCVCTNEPQTTSYSKALGKGIGIRESVGFVYLSRPRLPAGPLAM